MTKGGFVPRGKIVWVVAEENEELFVQDDLVVLLERDVGKATLFRTVETYIEPSQGIIDKWHLAERPYMVDPNTHFFRFLEEVDSRIVHDSSEVQEMFESMEGV
jgi:hypothetical protein